MAEMVFYPSGIDTSNSSYYGVSSSYPISGIVGNGTNNSGYGAGINLTRGSSGVTNVYINFDVSDIPENAVIDSVTCDVAIYGSSTLASRTSSRTARLCKGTAGVGTAVSWTVSGSTDTANITSSGTWTRDELDNLKLLVSATRNSSSTNSNTYMYIRGADLTITYTEDSGITYTVTVSSNDIDTDKTGENEVKENALFSLEIYGQVSSITDNGNDVTSQLVEKQPESGGTALSYPTAYSTSGSIRGTNYQNAIGKSSSNTASGNDYCSSSGSTATITYSFDFSGVPENATIESVSVVVGGHLESTTSSSEVARLQLYSGSTAKGSQTSFTTTSKQLITMEPGSWTRDELQNAALAFTIGYYGGLVNGVDFTVVYSIPGDGESYYAYTIASVTGDHLIEINAGETFTNLRIKVGGVWKKVKQIYRKENGVYVVKTIDDTKNYSNWVKL